MTAKLSAEEKAIIEYVESNQATSIADVESEKKTFHKSCAHSND
jgi:hypothetical protein